MDGTNNINTITTDPFFPHCWPCSRRPPARLPARSLARAPTCSRVQVLTYCPEWLGSDVVRIVRSVGKSPCSSYTAELLRNMCLHISMVFGFEISPKHQSFELGKLSIWFQVGDGAFPRSQVVGCLRIRLCVLLVAANPLRRLSASG